MGKLIKTITHSIKIY